MGEHFYPQASDWPLLLEREFQALTKEEKARAIELATRLGYTAAQIWQQGEFETWEYAVSCYCFALDPKGEEYQDKLARARVAEADPRFVVFQGSAMAEHHSAQGRQEA